MESPVIWQLVDSSGIGGIESHIASLAQVLAASGHKCKIVLMKQHGDNPWLAQLDKLGLDYNCLDGSLFDLWQAVKFYKPALIHTHGYKAGILGRIVALITGTPIVSTFHAGESAPFPVSLYQIVDSWSSFLGKRIAVNAIIAGQLPFGAEVIRNFIVFKPSTDRYNKPLSIGFVGRLSYEKGPDLFCKIARQADRKIEFHVFGDGPMRADLEARYAGIVQFHGVQTDMSAVWPQIGLLLMTSRAEGLPMAALEALSQGIPVIASPVGALPDVIKHGVTGWLCEPDDVEAAIFEIKIWQSLSVARHNSMAADCRADVDKRYGYAEPLRQILAVYRQAGWHR